MAKKRPLHILVGTRKGAYILDGDSDRKKWKVRGPFQDGRDVFMVRADPRSPGTVYVAANSAWFGPELHRSTDWGKRWTEVSVPQMPRVKDRKVSFDGPQPKWPIVNIWQILFGRDDEPGRMWLGVDPASLWRSDDGGATWEPVKGLNEHPTRKKWGPGAGGLCLHTILRDPDNPDRMYVGISAAGTFRTDDGGAHWAPNNKGVTVSFLPEKAPEFGQCVHKVAMDAANPAVLYRQDHDGIYVSRDHGDLWKHVGQRLDSDFGFVVASPKARPGEAYFVPLEGMARLTKGGQMQMVKWSEKDQKFTNMVPKGQFPGDFGNHRDALATDELDTPGIYFGSNAGNLFVSPNTGKTWTQVPFQFPGIHSVTVA
jgi:hypothetical protein